MLTAWGKKTAVALDSGFFRTLPILEVADKSKAEIAWLIYDLKQKGNALVLEKTREVYTMFHESLEKITKSETGCKKM